MKLYLAQSRPTKWTWDIAKGIDETVKLYLAMGANDPVKLRSGRDT